MKLFRLTALAVVALLSLAAPVAAWENNTVTKIIADCGGESGVTGSITVEVADAPFAFDIFLTYHVPGDATFHEVDGSRISVSYDESGTFDFDLDSSATPADANTVRVETTAPNDNEKSLSFGPCGASSTPTPTPTPPPPPPTPTPTPPESTPTPTATPPAVCVPEPPATDCGPDTGGGTPPPAHRTTPPTDTATVAETSTAPIGILLVIVALVSAMTAALLLRPRR